MFVIQVCDPLRYQKITNLTKGMAPAFDELECLGGHEENNHFTEESEERMPKDREVAIPKDLADVGPVQRCWVIANSMPGASRAEVLAACKELGINRNTAATQYQLWHYAKTQAHKARVLPEKIKQVIRRKAEVEARP